MAWLQEPIAFVEGGVRLVEQAEHCEVDLGMAMVASRIDQSADPVGSHQDVAAPQVAVEKRWCRSRRQSVRKVRGQRLDAPRQSGREVSKRRQKPTLGAEGRAVLCLAMPC